MTKQQFLLLKLMEECAEVSQRCSKQIQFGRYEVQDGQSLTNAERLKNELMDLEAVVRLLQDEMEIPQWMNSEQAEATGKKRQKLQKYLNLSRDLKILPEIIL